MSSQQADSIEEFEREVSKRGGNPKIDWEESSSAESRGVLFGDFEGVTLMVYPDGLVNIPARCSWSWCRYTLITAAASAKELWAEQKGRDERDNINRKKAQERQGGHLGPIVGPNLRCQEPDCPCQKPQDKRRKRARGGFNTKQSRCPSHGLPCGHLASPY